MSDVERFERVVEHERRHHRGRRWRRSRRILRIHAWVFVAVNLALVAAWATAQLVAGDTHPSWWVPTTAGWGVGLAVHALAVHRPWRRRARQPA